MSITKPSTNEIKALNYIRNSLIHKGVTPTIRELMAYFGYKSPRSAMLIINRLIELKYLKRNGRKLSLLKDNESEKKHAKTVEIPLVGTAPCGVPLLAEENIEATYPVSTELAKPGHKYFLLRTVGDSMNQKGINEGDIILVKQQDDADNGDTVVALIDNEATVKEIHKSQDMIILKPRSFNQENKPIILNKDFQVQGKVIAVISNL